MADSFDMKRPQMWPALPLAEWQDTLDTVHMWTQVVGKVTLELAPFLNEWWQIAFQVSAHGLTTSTIPYDRGVFAVEFDFVSHNLVIRTSRGDVKMMPLYPRSVADFYQEFMAVLHALGIDVEINTIPAEIVNPIPFDQDHGHSSYDAGYVERWWQILVQTEKVLQQFRSPFIGKSSPICFYWGSFDLNEARFSGRPAPVVPGMLRFLQLAEDQENFSCGFWPGNANMAGLTYGEPAFYAYTYPAPAGFSEASVRPAGAFYDTELGEFLFRYDDARRAESPERAILDFFQSTYEAAANLSDWNRNVLERTPPDVIPG
jgi:hypothetical protein